MGMDLWRPCPIEWIRREKKLRLFSFGRSGGAHHTTALMCFAVIVHNAETSGIAKITYDRFEEIIGKSRTQISKGLQTLGEFEIITSTGEQSKYEITDYDLATGWAKFPCRSLYTRSNIPLFNECRLRKRTELDALKLMFLFIAFRDGQTNRANISYEKISDYTGISRQFIRPALGLLAAYNICFPIPTGTEGDGFQIFNSYQVQGIDSYRHAGTSGRQHI